MPLHVLEIMPLRILPPRTPRRQRHVPRVSSDYSHYRACLRWDAGFTCCFCLVHESDLARDGAESTGLTSIEHLVPQSVAPHLVNVYDNCAYACRFCNNARGIERSVHPSGARLLHPWRDAWGAHFRLHEDRLEPLQAGDDGRDARYTLKVYRLNDSRKVEMRCHRRIWLQTYLDMLELDLKGLRRIAAQSSSDEERTLDRDRIRKLQEWRKLAGEELSRRTAIPLDAPTSCRCEGREHHCLPLETEVLRVRLG
jgi:5-methylcytosine-specific restriction endonuclease McrA